MSMEVLTLEGTVRLKENIVNILLPKYIRGFSISINEWTDNAYTLNCSAIKSSSIIHVYYNDSQKEYIESLNVEYQYGDGFLKILVGSVPDKKIQIDSIAIENPFVYYTES